MKGGKIGMGIDYQTICLGKKCEGLQVKMLELEEGRGVRSVDVASNQTEDMGFPGIRVWTKE